MPTAPRCSPTAPATSTRAANAQGRPPRRWHRRARTVGWTLPAPPPLDGILAANLKWLAGYRHPRNAGRPGLTEAVLAAFTRPRPLIEGAEAAGDPIAVLPAVFHALWHGQLTACLDTPLHERVPVGPQGWSGPETGDAG